MNFHVLRLDGLLFSGPFIGKKPGRVFRTQMNSDDLRSARQYRVAVVCQVGGGWNNGLIRSHSDMFKAFPVVMMRSADETEDPKKYFGLDPV